jgi:hypothetical protein
MDGFSPFLYSATSHTTISKPLFPPKAEKVGEIFYARQQFK